MYASTFLNQIGFKSNQDKRKQLTFMKNSPRSLPRWMPRLLPLAAALALAACSTQPAYQPPRLDVPARFKGSHARRPASSASGNRRRARQPAWPPQCPTSGGRCMATARSISCSRRQPQAIPAMEQAVACLRSAQAAVASSRAAQLPTLEHHGQRLACLTGGGTYSNTNGENVARSGSINNNFAGLEAPAGSWIWGKLGRGGCQPGFSPGQCRRSGGSAPLGPGIGGPDLFRCVPPRRR